MRKGRHTRVSMFLLLVPNLPQAPPTICRAVYVFNATLRSELDRRPTKLGVRYGVKRAGGAESWYTRRKVNPMKECLNMIFGARVGWRPARYK